MSVNIALNRTSNEGSLLRTQCNLANSPRAWITAGKSRSSLLPYENKSAYAAFGFAMCPIFVYGATRELQACDCVEGIDHQ
jgi:hypothetical protein